MPIAHRAGSPYTAYAASVGGIAVTIGDLIVVFGSGYSAGTLTCSDNAAGGTNSYTNTGQFDVAATPPWGAGMKGAIFWAKAKATETLTVTIAGISDLGLSVHVYSGVAPSSPQDGSTVTLAEPSASTSHTSPNITTGTANCVIVAFVFQEIAAASSSAWTNSFVGRTSQSGHVHHTADRVVSSATTYSTGFTSSVSQPYAWILAAFKEEAPTNPVGKIVSPKQAVQRASNF